MPPHNISSTPNYWVIVPAAGVGSRMGADLPKQYLSLLDKTILEHTLERLLQLPDIAGILLALSPDDTWWQELPLSRDPRIVRVDGGLERSYSVLNALKSLSLQAIESDWVLVHDAARPCVTLGAIAYLREQLEYHQVGGILAVPVSDTIKQLNRLGEIVQTLDRSSLWQAQTPQMFRYGLLLSCLERTLNENLQITDEASALESCGYTVRVVEGRVDNIKITRVEDLPLAQTILQQQGKST